MKEYCFDTMQWTLVVLFVERAEAMNGDVLVIVSLPNTNVSSSVESNDLKGPLCRG